MKAATSKSVENIVRKGGSVTKIRLSNKDAGTSWITVQNGVKIKVAGSIKSK